MGFIAHMFLTTNYFQAMVYRESMHVVKGPPFIVNEISMLS